MRKVFAIAALALLAASAAIPVVPVLSENRRSAPPAAAPVVVAATSSPKPTKPVTVKVKSWPDAERAAEPPKDLPQAKEPNPATAPRPPPASLPAPPPAPTVPHIVPLAGPPMLPYANQPRVVTGPTIFRAPILQNEGPLYTPYDSVRFALADANAIALAAGKGHASFGIIEPSHIRYLSLYNIRRSQRDTVTKVVAFVINSLSRETTIVNWQQLIVPNTDGTLLRLNLDDYTWKTSFWDKLAEVGSGPADRQTPDPYFHAILEQRADHAPSKPTPKAAPKGGQRTRAAKPANQPASPGVDRKKVEQVLVAAPWLALERGGADGQPGSSIAALTDILQTRNPILRADWFVSFAFWSPRYYDFLGLGRKEADFDNLVFADEEKAIKARTQIKAVVVDSRVALNARSLIRFPTINHPGGGFYWESNDAKKSVKGSNPVQNLLRSQFDAKEIIASLANGMQAYAVTDNKGELLDLADAAVAQDFRTPLQDKQIYVGRNCAACHDQGMWFIADKVRRLSQREIGLMIPDKKDAKRVRDLFFAYDVKPLIDRDSALYEAAVFGVTGLRPPAASKAMENVTYNYLDRRLTLSQVALEVGVPEDKLLPLLKRAINVDFTITGLLQNPPEEDVRRDQWERDGFPQLMQYLLATGAWNN